MNLHPFDSPLWQWELVRDLLPEFRSDRDVREVWYRNPSNPEVLHRKVLQDTGSQKLAKKAYYEVVNLQRNVG